MRVTIYRDSTGLPAWATVEGIDIEAESELLSRLRSAIIEGDVVFGFDGDIEFEVV